MQGGVRSAGHLLRISLSIASGLLRRGGKEFTLPLTLDLRISVILILQALPQQTSDSPPDDRIRQQPRFHRVQPACFMVLPPHLTLISTTIFSSMVVIIAVYATLLRQYSYNKFGYAFNTGGVMAIINVKRFFLMPVLLLLTGCMATLPEIGSLPPDPIVYPRA